MATLLELIQKVEIKLQASGAWPSSTTLTNPGINQADPFVNLVTTNMAGLVNLHNRLISLKSGLSPQDAEGEDLTYVADLMGSPRQIDQASVVY